MFLKGVIIKLRREQMLREKMKGWSEGFPTTLRLIKPEKDNFKKHEGSSQPDPVYQNTARTSKTNPTHNPTATFEREQK